MPDSYYYQDNNGQIVGPLAPQALKQLANQGVVTENTLVRKGEQGAWYLASTLAGLLPPRPNPSEPFATPEKDPAERARQAFQKAEQHADKVAAKLWFLDLKFTHFFTPKLAGALWAIFLCLLAIEFLISFFQSLALLPSRPFMSLGGMLLAVVGLIFGVVCSRVVLEVILLAFRIADRLENLKHLESRPAAPAGGGGGFAPTAPGPFR